MFDIGASELLLIVIVAIVVIGPKDLPLALRTAGRWIGKVRRVSGHFRSGIETMIREAELEDMEKKWREQNAAIMQAHPQDEHAPIASPSAENAFAHEGGMYGAMSKAEYMEADLTSKPAEAAPDEAQPKATKPRKTRAKKASAKTSDKGAPHAI